MSIKELEYIFETEDDEEVVWAAVAEFLANGYEGDPDCDAQ